MTGFVELLSRHPWLGLLDGPGDQIACRVDSRELHSRCSSLIQRTTSILPSFTSILDESMRVLTTRTASSIL
jgi:hypothetical protein